MKPTKPIVPDVKLMLQQLPVEQRLEASVSLISFAVAEFANVVLELAGASPINTARRQPAAPRPKAPTRRRR